VRIDLSRQMVDVLVRDIEGAYDALAAEKPGPRTATKADLWTAPERSSAQAKQRLSHLFHRKG